jgi:hypothetical protein
VRTIDWAFRERTAYSRGALAPLALTVKALLMIRWVVPQLLAVILGPALALTRGVTAHGLVRVIAGRSEDFPAVWAGATRHPICIAQEGEYSRQRCSAGAGISARANFSANWLL